MNDKWTFFRLMTIGTMLFFIQTLCIFSTYGQHSVLAEQLKSLDTYEKKWGFYFSSVISKDSVETLLKNNIPDRERLELLLFHGQRQGIRSKSKGKKESVQALEIARSLELPLQEAMALRLLALGTDLDKASNKSLEYANKALQLAERVQDHVLKADIYNNLYFVFKHRENHIEAIRCFLKSVDLIYEYGGYSIKNIKSLALTRVSLTDDNFSLASKTIKTVDYDSLNNSYKSLYLKLKIRIMRSEGHADSIEYYNEKLLRELPSAETFQTVADNFMLENNLTMALQYYLKSAAIKKAKSEYTAVYSKIAQTYKMRGMKDSTEHFMIKNLDNVVRFEKKHDEPKAHVALASFYLDNNELSKAERAAKKGYEAAKAYDLTESLVRTTEILGKVTSLEGQFDQAYEYLERSRVYAERLSREEHLSFCRNLK